MEYILTTEVQWFACMSSVHQQSTFIVQAIIDAGVIAVSF